MERTPHGEQRHRRKRGRGGATTLVSTKSSAASSGRASRRMRNQQQVAAARDAARRFASTVLDSYLRTSQKLRLTQIDTLRSEISSILRWISPSVPAEAQRNSVLSFSVDLLKRAGFEACLVGSYGLRTYLPDSDIDLVVRPCGETDCSRDTVLNGKDGHSAWYMRVNEALCVESTTNSIGRRWGDGQSRPAGSVRNVSFVNAQVKVVNCTVNNLSVDFSEVSAGPLASIALFESIDRLVGRNHVFKKSVILIKAWLKYEAQRWALKESAQELGTKRRRMKRGSAKRGGISIVSGKGSNAVGSAKSVADAASANAGATESNGNGLLLMGARVGGLSSSAVTVLVASLFFSCMSPHSSHSPPAEPHDAGASGSSEACNKEPGRESAEHSPDSHFGTSESFTIQHPLDALVIFFRTYASMDWTKWCVTLCGPMPLQEPRNDNKNDLEEKKSADSGNETSPFWSSKNRLYKLRLARDMVYRALGGTPHARKVADILASSSAAQYGFSKRRSWNVVDPFDPRNNLARSLQPDKAALLARSLMNGQSALADDVRRAMTQSQLKLSRKSRQHGSGARNSAQLDRHATDLYTSCRNMFGRGDGWRPDLLVHPCQQWIPQGKQWQGGNKAPPTAAAAAVGFDSLAPKDAQLLQCIETIKSLTSRTLPCLQEGRYAHQSKSSSLIVPAIPKVQRIPAQENRRTSFVETNEEPGKILPQTDGASPTTTDLSLAKKRVSKQTSALLSSDSPISRKSLETVIQAHGVSGEEHGASGEGSAATEAEAKIRSHVNPSVVKTPVRNRERERDIQGSPKEASKLMSPVRDSELLRGIGMKEVQASNSVLEMRSLSKAQSPLSRPTWIFSIFILTTAFVISLRSSFYQATLPHAAIDRAVSIDDVRARRMHNNMAASELFAPIWEARGKVVQSYRKEQKEDATQSHQGQTSQGMQSIGFSSDMAKKAKTTTASQSKLNDFVDPTFRSFETNAMKSASLTDLDGSNESSDMCNLGNEPTYGPLTANETFAVLLQAHPQDQEFKSLNMDKNSGTSRSDIVVSTSDNFEDLLSQAPVSAVAPSAPLARPLVKSHRSRQWTTVGSQTLLGADVESVEGQTLTYQWRQNGVDVPGATSALYVIHRVSLEDAGTYTCAVSNGDLVAVWEEVMLHVSSPPVVNSEFRKITATKGARLALAVPFVMANPAPSFQWRLNGVDIPGAVSQQYDIEGASQADVGTYTCVLENLAGMTIWEETIVELQA